MPIYQRVEADYQRYIGPSDRSTDVFVHADRSVPINWPLGKQPKISEGRQRHFELQLQRISETLGLGCIPVHIEWRDGQRNQMDKGCIGHSFGPQGAIASVAINHQGEVTHIILGDCRMSQLTDLRT